MATTWDRSDEQRREALRRANEVRCQRADLKRRIAAGDVSALDIIAWPPKCCATMRAADLVMAVRGVGSVKAKKILAEAGVSPSRTLAGLTPRQRRDLVAALSSRVIGPGH